jgi:hypothetical protein
VAALSEPANPTWVMARIAALLEPYFDKGTPQGVREIEAEDWAEALCRYPQWALQRAVRWWKSADNPKRRQRPIEGDIEARVRVEMDAVLGMKRRLEAGLYREAGSEPERVLPSPERRAEMQDYAAKHFPTLNKFGA